MASPPEIPPAPPRLQSLDALRGFAMMWIIGGDAVGSALAGLDGGRLVRFCAHQMEHSEWAGFTFYDLIFPLFIFMVGVAIPLSLDRLVAREGRPGALRRVMIRGGLMFVLGVLYYGGIAQGVQGIRLLGVLQRLAICYVAVSLLYVYVRPRVLAAVAIALLVIYWALLSFVPVPGFGAGDFARGHNLANWIDLHYLPFKVWYGDYDPEGLLSTLPAIVSALLGLFAGRLVCAERYSPWAKVTWLALGGAVLIALGYAWSIQFPVIKRVWTSSFVLVAGGWSAVLLAVFYALIEIRGWRTWARPLVWIGTNALAIYVVSRLVDFNHVSAFLFGGEVKTALNALWPGLGALVLAATGISLCVLLCRFLYVRKIFLRL